MAKRKGKRWVDPAELPEILCFFTAEPASSAEMAQPAPMTPAFPFD